MSKGGPWQWRTVAAELQADGMSHVEIARVLRERFSLGALAAMRHANGWSQSDAAHEWRKRWPRQPKTYKDLSAWETGRNTPPLDVFDQLAQLYRCDLGDLLADRPGYRPDDQDQAYEDDYEAAAQQDTQSPLPDSVADVDRRDLLAALGSTFATAAVGGQVFSHAKDVPPELATHYTEQFAVHVARHGQLGARPLLGTVITEYASVKEAASVAPSGLQDELDGLAVAYANLVGWLYQDLGDFGRSWHWRSMALELAHRTDDPTLVAYALAELALLRRDAGDGQAAVDLTERALAIPDVPHTVRSFTLRQAAHAYSLTGDRDAMERSLDEAAAAAELVHEQGADDRYSWFPSSWWGGTQNGNRAVCLMRLGEMAEAAELLSQTLEVIPAEARRYRGITSARLASTLVELEGPSAALESASDAVDCFTRMRSSFLERELGELQHRARKRAASQGGRELVDVLRSVA